MRIYFYFIVALFALVSCDKPFDINDDWSDITVVYGVLNQADTAHYIRINKAFLGNGNAYDMAKESDSIQYSNVLKACLIEYSFIDGATDPYYAASWRKTNRDTIRLWRTSEIEKDPTNSHGDEGIFETDNNYLYKTTEKLNGLYKYILSIQVPGKPEPISSETFIIDNFVVKLPQPNRDLTYNSPIHLENYIKPYATDWKSAIYGKVYEITLRFNYLEIQNADTTHHYVDIDYPSQVVPTLRLPINLSTDMSQQVGGSAFYSNVGRKIVEKEGVRRIALNVDFIYSIGGDNLNTYLSSSSASSNFGQNKVEYSNIINGHGIFAARFTHVIKGKIIADAGVDSLAYGYYTKNLHFANAKNLWE